MELASLRPLSDGALDQALSIAVQNERAGIVSVVAHIAEFDSRRLYRTKGHPSMFSYCVHRLGYSEQAAYKRIRAARLGRRFPVVLRALEDGCLHLAAITLLAPHIRSANVDQLVAAATGCTRREIEELLAERFPKPDLPTRIMPLGQLQAAPKLDAGRVLPAARPALCELSPGRVPNASGEDISTPIPEMHARVEATPHRYGLQVTIAQGTRDKLCRAQELLGFAVATGDVAAVLDRALDALIAQLEKRRCGRTETPRTARPSQDPRHVPAAVRRTVWARDGHRCTYVGDDGQRCPERTGLELDHVLPVSRGGGSTPPNLRLRCRAHNQLEAENVLGKRFMEQKRESAIRTRQAAC